MNSLTKVWPERTQALDPCFAMDCISKDSLTGLADRQCVLHSLGNWLAQPEPPDVSIILFNIENFRSVNHSFDHSLGDRWLCAVARRLQAKADSYCLVGRMSGDEFLLVTANPKLGKTQVPFLAKSISANLSRPVAVGNNVLKRTVRSFYSCSHDREVTAEQLLREAEQGMRKLRQRTARLPSRSKYSESRDCDDLQLAIDAGRQIEVHYQPEVDLKTGGLVGLEALVRWRHPRRGLQPASRFIQLAERSGLVVPLSWLVLNRALGQMQQWRESHADFAITVRVNASPLQIMGVGFAGRVLEVLAFHGLPASTLCVEVTEHQIMQCQPSVAKELQILRSEGVSIALDDFGVGHSSLSRLRDIPTDCLKIDQSFIKGSCMAESDRNLLQMITRLADAYGLLAVAEGIETEAELKTVQALGITRGQGNYFSSAVMPENVEQFFSGSFFDNESVRIRK